MPGPADYESVEVPRLRREGRIGPLKGEGGLPLYGVHDGPGSNQPDLYRDRLASAGGHSDMEFRTVSRSKYHLTSGLRGVFSRGNNLESFED